MIADPTLWMSRQLTNWLDRSKLITIEFNKGPIVMNYDVESLGHRLDTVRSVLKNVSPDTWASDFWKQVEAQLVRKIKKQIAEKFI